MTAANMARILTQAACPLSAGSLQWVYDRTDVRTIECLCPRGARKNRTGEEERSVRHADPGWPRPAQLRL